jgi:hypothetical protein
MAPTSQPGDYDAVRASIRGVLKQEDYDDGALSVPTP